jgi:hypothetical protein
MNPRVRKLHILLIFTVSLTCCLAQKVKVGFDKDADFSKYKSFTILEPTAPSSRPMLRDSVLGTIREDLQAKGLTNAEKEGDLTVIPTGGLGYELSSELKPSSCDNCKAPALDAQWPQYMAPPGGGGTPLPKGTLALTMVDRAANKVVWSGTVSQKLNPEKKDQSLQKIYAAIHKLLAEYPPGK